MDIVIFIIIIIIIFIFPPADPQGLLFSLSDSMTPSRVYSLIESLTDTFEHNKTDAYTVLSALPHQKIQVRERGKG